MGINININRLSRLNSANTEGLPLLILTQVESKDAKKAPQLIHNVKELHEKFKARSQIIDDATVVSTKGLYQLQVAEYLLSTDTSVLVYPTQGADVFSMTSDSLYVKDIGVLDYKQILAPYEFITKTPNTNITQLAKLVQSTGELALNLSAQLFLDLKLEPDTFNSDGSLATVHGVEPSPKIEVFTNSATVQFYSEITQKFVLNTEDYVGIPASAFVAARKAKLLKDKAPWYPVAGQTYGAVPEAIELYRTLSTFEKNELQSKNINVLTSKPDFGALFVSQNTLYTSESEYEPLNRSHVVTQALWIKRQVYNLLSAFEQLPSNTKTWTMIDLKLRTFFDEMFDSDGLEELAQILLGRDLTTEKELRQGKLNISVNYVPIRALETINVNINIVEDGIEYIEIGGII